MQDHVVQKVARLCDLIDDVKSVILLHLQPQRGIAVLVLKNVLVGSLVDPNLLVGIRALLSTRYGPDDELVDMHPQLAVDGLLAPKKAP